MTRKSMEFLYFYNYFVNVRLETDYLLLFTHIYYFSAEQLQRTRVQIRKKNDFNSLFDRLYLCPIEKKMINEYVINS